ncbi:hypothetical protein CMV_004993 [Castanea mollissima]|uniref:Uncharacterized protein n=1 Tax=Castanea mollissima TaxID=60419 RepID=A0A8J4REG5_9ROSI|nr:hypothetical protein CMV_004993 [Castanea mollissima]
MWGVGPWMPPPIATTIATAAVVDLHCHHHTLFPLFWCSNFLKVKCLFKFGFLSKRIEHQGLNHCKFMYKIWPKPYIHARLKFLLSKKLDDLEYLFQLRHLGIMG